MGANFLMAGAAQIQARPFAKRENEEKICTFLEQGAREGIQLLVFPEYAHLGTVVEEKEEYRQKFLELAEEGEGPFSRRISRLCQDKGINCFYVTYERAGKLLYVTGILALRDGTLFSYRKMHLYSNPSFRERFYASAGDTYQVVPVEGVAVGLQICYDIVFPENARILTLKGARVLLEAAAWPASGGLRWEALLSGRAVENQLYVVGSGMASPFYGHSRIVNYRGEILAQGGKEESIISAPLDIEAQDTWRREFLTPLFDRRPQLYGDILQPFKEG